ncbi:MAG: GntR family transcriptional regulator, partial [Chloroflexi bacterium]|nr:GntR family transcriptional regulator [Chloroflexota bacterium]
MKEDTDEPLYRQIARKLRTEIEEQLRPGDSIGTEAELEQRFSVSRITVRRAIDELVHAGLLVRRQGSGTFVARAKVTEELGVLYSWTERM